MLEKRHAVMVRLLVLILWRTFPHLKLLYTLERTCMMRELQNSSVNGNCSGTNFVLRRKACIC